MVNYIMRRVIQNLALLFFISMLIYVVLNLVPGGPFDLSGNPTRASPSL